MVRRGFVALEDVSIVVPMAVAIILFFSALAWAISTIQDTNASVDLTLKAVDIADVFASPGVITKSSFDQACTSAETLASGYHFVAYLTNPDNPITLEDIRGGTYPTLMCPNPATTLFSPNQIPKNRTVLVRAFPIPFQESGSALPYNDVNLLVVVVWQGA